MRELNQSVTQLEVEVSRDDGRSTIRLSGELDAASAPRFTEALERERAVAETAIVDLAPLTFADSTGVKALVEAVRAVRSGTRLVMTRPTGEVDRLFELTGLHALLPYEPDAIAG